MSKVSGVDSGEEGKVHRGRVRALGGDLGELGTPVCFHNFARLTPRRKQQNYGNMIFVLQDGGGIKPRFKEPMPSTYHVFVISHVIFIPSTSNYDTRLRSARKP